MKRTEPELSAAENSFTGIDTRPNETVPDAIGRGMSSILAPLIYGANGYTGELLAREAVRRGLRPVLAGRSAEPVAALASELGLEARSFGLDDRAALREGLGGALLVIHCAGPFSRTARPMVDACLEARVHYIDITGEIAVFESLATLDAEARAAGVMLLPGAGFDVVPSDCLAAHVSRKLPSATHLTLAFRSGGGISRGTATTMVENLGSGGAVRRNGRLTRVSAAWRTREFDFGRGPRRAVTIPWGDVSTAFHSTGIPNIEVYTAAPSSAIFTMRLSRLLGPLLGSAPVQSFLTKRIRGRPSGPDARAREKGRSSLWAEARNEATGERATARLTGPEGYTMTVRTALAIAERVGSGAAPVGFQTPSKAYGADFVLKIDGVEREDL